MSRTAAKQKFSWCVTQKDLEKQGVRVLSAGATKCRASTSRFRRDAVSSNATWSTSSGVSICGVAKMCGDGSKAEGSNDARLRVSSSPLAGEGLG